MDNVFSRGFVQKFGEFRKQGFSIGTFVFGQEFAKFFCRIFNALFDLVISGGAFSGLADVFERGAFMGHKCCID